MSSFCLPASRLRAVLSLGCALALLTGCGSGLVGRQPYSGPTAIVSSTPTQVSVPPLPGEDLYLPCAYTLLLPAGTARTIMGTLVVFERGDSTSVFHDSSLQKLAGTLSYAMVFASECDSFSSGNFQADATKGPGRALLAAMTQFATNTAHPELANGRITLFGFSAAGVLSASLTTAHPERISGAIVYAPGDEYLALEAIPVTAATAAVPMLILGNAQDAVAGTWRGMDYYSRGRALQASWGFGVQNATEHCCTLSTLNVLKPWISAIATAEAGAAAQAPAFPTASFTTFSCDPDGTWDPLGHEDCSFSGSGVSAKPIPGQGAAGWLPDTATGAAWLTWVTNPVTN